MKTLGIAAGALVCAGMTSAFAQSPPPLASDESDVLKAPVRAPDKAFELGVEAGYTQGFGSITSDPRVAVGPGGTVGVSVGYRTDPHWSVSVGGQYQGYGSTGVRPGAATLRGVTADVNSTYHLSPYERLDPYVAFGAGYRLFAESPAGNAPTTLTHSLELGKIEVGLDVRPSESMAISPVLGVDVNLLMLRAGGVETASLRNGAVNTFVFAGVQGRFDVGGTRDDRPAR